jgi:protein-S-isoprenylcysteine O-methyltransferase Ste14
MQLNICSLAVNGRSDWRKGRQLMAATRRLAFLTMMASVAYLGLAVLGSGGFHEFFSHPARNALAISALALSAGALFCCRNISYREHEIRANHWGIVAFLLTGVVAAYLLAHADRHELMTFGGDEVRWSGIALFIVGGVLRIWAALVLGRRLCRLVGIDPGHTLITTGVYGVIRHPSYLGFLVNLLGWVLAFRSGAGMVVAVLFAFPLAARIRSEEKLLSRHYGSEYDAYCSRTWRLIPGIY